MTWKFWRRNCNCEGQDEHEEINRRLDQGERELLEHARRLRVLELEAGIIAPKRRR